MSVTFGGGPFVEGQTYTGTDGVSYCYQDGCFIIARPEDVDTDTDTQDGYALPGISPVGASDFVSGEVIEPGSPVVAFYGSDGALIGYKDCTDADEFGVLIDAPGAGTDSAGNVYAQGDPLIRLPDNSLVCVSKTVDTNTFAGLIVAGSAATDDAGNEYEAGASLIQLADGSLVCAEKTLDTVDGYSEQGISDGSQRDADGGVIAAGSPIITFYDATGKVINSKDCTDEDTFAVGVSNGDGTATLTFPNAPPLQVCEVCSTTETVNGVTTTTNGDGTKHVTVDLLDKRGNVFQGPITPLTVEGIAEGNLAATSRLLTLNSAGDCRSVPVPGRARDCEGEIYAAGTLFTPLTTEQGHAPALPSNIRGLENVDQSCAPEPPECNIPGTRQTTQNSYGTVDWEWNGDSWVATGFSAKRFSKKAQILSPLLSEAILSGSEVFTPAVSAGSDALPEETLDNSWKTIARACVELVNDDCVPWVARYDTRAAFSGSIGSQNFWSGRIVGSETLPNGALNGTAQHRNDARCWPAEDGCNYLFDDVIEAQSPGIYEIPPGETLRACVDMQYRVSQYEFETNNQLGAQAFALVAEVTRDCGR